jgi:hypothetical protein
VTAREIKEAVAPGSVWDVTNHYITREDHPCYGTRRLTITRVTSGAFYVTSATALRSEDRIPWPPARQMARREDGTIRLCGGGAAQQPHEPFLTLRPVTP